MSRTRTTLSALLVAALLVVAGCAGPAGVPGDGTAGSGTAGDGAAGDGAAATTPVSGGAVGGNAGTVRFYVSDQPNAIDDFRHLNVTITMVGLHRTGDAPGGPNETATPNATATEIPNATATETPVATATPNATTTPANDTATPDGPTATPEEDGEEDDEGDEEAGEDDEEDGDEEDDGEDGDEGDGDGRWVEYEVNRTVDLTELQGANASLLDELAAPSGNYNKVFVYVGEIDATLESGESVDVHLPSDRLHINRGFTIGDGQDVSFVFDIAIHRAGNSGRYILRPVVGQSGTGEEVEIRDVDERRGPGGEGGPPGDDDGAAGEAADDGDDRGADDDETDDGSAELSAEFVGPVRAGEEATVKATADGPVEGATVAVDGEVVGETGPDGTLSFAVPEDAEEVEVTVTVGDDEAELSRDLGGGNGQGDEGQGSDALLDAPAVG